MLSDYPGGLTPIEKLWIWVMRENQSHKRVEIRKKILVGQFRVQFLWQNKKNHMGRFGGGWNWELGVQVGGRTVVVNLFVCSLRIDRLVEASRKKGAEHGE